MILNDSITLDRIKLAHPKIREELLKYYLEINSKLPKNCRLRFAYVFRTPEEQHKLFLQKPKVTNADSWQSIHNYGLAFDIVLLYDKDNNGSFETPSWTNDDNWKKVVEYFKSKGYEWGGDWKFKDAPHFQKAFNNTWKQLKTKIDNKQYVKENNILYPNI
jgi:peptidoglycan L-alanyl-D-glutamate endopeptidase CwlK